MLPWETARHGSPRRLTRAEEAKFNFISRLEVRSVFSASTLALLADVPPKKRMELVWQLIEYDKGANNTAIGKVYIT